MVAEKSVPPRPRVVVAPFSVSPMKPATTGVRPAASRPSRRSRTRWYVPGSGLALPKCASVRMPACPPVRWWVGRPICASASVISGAERRSPKLTIRSRLRAVSSRSRYTP